MDAAADDAQLRPAVGLLQLVHPGAGSARGPLRARAALRRGARPSFKDLSPRFGASCDLFGDGKTAIKGSVSKYVSKFATDNVNAYSPMFLASDSRTWNDLNRDDIAQDNEIGPSNNNAFGIRQSRNPDPNLKREIASSTPASFSAS